MVRREEDEADARSLMDLMMLGAGIGSGIEVEAEGTLALEALDANRRRWWRPKFDEGE